MRQIRGHTPFPGERRSYRVGSTVVDVWHRTLDEDYIEVFIEIIQPPGSEASTTRTYYDGEECLVTTAIARFALDDLTWEEFLASPEDFLLEILL